MSFFGDIKSFFTISAEETGSSLIKIGARNMLRLAAIGMSYTNENEDLKWIAVDFYKFVERLDSVEIIAKGEQEEAHQQLGELELVLKGKLRELGVYDEVYALFLKDSERVYGSIGK